MKKIFFSFFFIIFLWFNMFAQDDSEVSREKGENNSSSENKSISFSVPENPDEIMDKRGLNWLEKSVNREIIKAVKSEQVTLTKLESYIYLQVIPFYIYGQGPEGERKLRDDITRVLGTVNSPSETKIMPLPIAELETMGLPFDRKITDSMILPPELFFEHIDITFFIDMNILTGRVGEALRKMERIKPVYNSKNRFYRVMKKGSELRYFVHIANIAYEIAYTGRIPESIIKRMVKEIEFLVEIMDEYEEKLKKSEALAFDGRYVKGDNVYIDILYLYEETGGNNEKIEKIMKKAFSSEKVNIRSKFERDSS